MDVELPEGAMVTNALAIVLYLDADGANRYQIVTGGDGQMTTYVGMAAVTQHKLIEIFNTE